MDELRKYLLSLGFYRGMQPAGTDSLSSPVGKSDGRTVVPCLTVDFPRGRDREAGYRFWANGVAKEFDELRIEYIKKAYRNAIEALATEVESQ